MSCMVIWLLLVYDDDNAQEVEIEAADGERVARSVKGDSLEFAR